MSASKLPFYRRLWWWTIAAPLILAFAIALFAFAWGLSQDTGYIIAFRHFTGTPDGPVYNLTDEQAAELPGNIPRLLTQAKLKGVASESLTPKELAKFEEGIRNSPFILYQGSLFKREQTIVLN